MPRSSTKSLTFPLAGVSRRGTYRKRLRPYTAPWAINVRTFGPSESRRRGGSRPGLEKLCATDLGDGVQVLLPLAYIDSAGVRQRDLVYVASTGSVGYIRAGVATTVAVASVQDALGVLVQDAAGLTIDFPGTLPAGTTMQATALNGKAFLADDVLRSFDPATGAVDVIVATAGIVPAAQPVICTYRARLFLAGVDNNWYASRPGKTDDWDFGAAREDAGRAIRGQLSAAGLIGDKITAMIPIRDQALVVATESTLWVLSGDPSTGSLNMVSSEIGIVSSNAWALDPDGLLVFLSNDGIYQWRAGARGGLQRFSEERIPDELREVDPAAVTISMGYDPVEVGFHLFLTPASGVGLHWWIDVESRAFWPMRLAEAHQPTATVLLPEGGLGDVVLGGQDGFLRHFAAGADDDDSVALESHVLIGPVRIAADDVRDALLAEIHGVLDGVTAAGTVTWRVVMGGTAEEAATLARADVDLDLAGSPLVSVAAFGSWVEGHNRVARPRSRGPWVVVWLSSTAAWSYEVVSIVSRQLGRHR